MPEIPKVETTLTLSLGDIAALAVALPNVDRMDLGTRTRIELLERRVQRVLDANRVSDPRGLYR